MSAPTFLTARQAKRVRDTIAAIEAGLSQRQAAAKMGLSPAGLTAMLQRVTDHYAWPPHVPTLQALLKLPINDIKRARKLWAQSAYAGHGETRGSQYPDRARLSEDEVKTRRDQAAAARAAHERRHLIEEQQKYGLRRAGRPLSRMAV